MYVNISIVILVYGLAFAYLKGNVAFWKKIFHRNTHITGGEIRPMVSFLLINEDIDNVLLAGSTKPLITPRLTYNG